MSFDGFFLVFFDFFEEEVSREDLENYVIVEKHIIIP